MENTTRLLELSQRRLQLGHLDGAIDSLRQLLSQDPDHGAAHALLSVCLLGRRRLHAARREAELALAAEPELELAHYAAGRVAIADRKFSVAEKHLALLLEMDPLDAGYHRLMAELYDLSGRRKQMLPLLEKALELGPADPANLSALAEYYLGRGEFGRAEHFARQALHQHADHVDALVVMGRVLLKRGDWREAREHAAWALTENPQSVGALYLMSAVKARRNPLMGVWWRYNSWMTQLGSTRSVIVLLAAYLLYRLASIAAADAGHPEVARVIDFLWLGVVVFSIAAPGVFLRSLKKELAGVQLARGF